MDKIDRLLDAMEHPDRYTPTDIEAMLNPVTVTKSKDLYYIEALQHGKYVYTGRVIGRDNEPVEYYIGNFNVFAYYSTPSKYIEEQNGYTERTSSRYMLSLGWHLGPWHANVTAYNFLHTSWKAGMMTLNSQYYDYKRQEFNTNQHQRFSLSVSYTFNYGKKVNSDDETSGIGTAGSAILK